MAGNHTTGRSGFLIVVFVAALLFSGCQPRLDLRGTPNGPVSEYLDERLVPVTPDKAKYRRRGMVWNHGPLLDFAYPYGDFHGTECPTPGDTAKFMDGTYQVDDRRGRYKLIQRYEHGLLVDSKLTRPSGAYELYEFKNAYDLTQPFVHYLFVDGEGVVIKELCYTHECHGRARTFKNCDPMTIARTFPRCDE